MEKVEFLTKGQLRKSQNCVVFEEREKKGRWVLQGEGEREKGERNEDAVAAGVYENFQRKEVSLQKTRSDFD